MRQTNTLRLVRIAVVTALYVALSMAISPLTYGLIQIRFAEMLVLLCCYNKDYCWSMILGCIIVNAFSPLGWVDVVFGTLGSVVAVLCTRLLKQEYLAFLPPTIFTIFVAFEFYFVMNEPFWLSYSTIMLGEFIAVGIIGTPVFMLLSKRSDWLKLIGADDRYMATRAENQRKKHYKKIYKEAKKQLKLSKIDPVNNENVNSKE